LLDASRGDQPVGLDQVNIALVLEEEGESRLGAADGVAHEGTNGVLMKDVLGGRVRLRGDEVVELGEVDEGADARVEGHDVLRGDHLWSLGQVGHLGETELREGEEDQKEPNARGVHVWWTSQKEKLLTREYGATPDL